MQITDRTKKIVAGKVFDPERLEFLHDQVITVSETTGLIHDVQPLKTVETLDYTSADVIDLRELTVLPGLVDTHVHFFLHPYSETSWNDQLTEETLVERTVRAVNHAKSTLMAGYTTVRDLGTEGAEDADIALRKCISGRDSLTPGPRYFVCNRAIAPTGSYGPKGNLRINEDGVNGIYGVEFADGPDECKRAIRRQIGAGADWIKIYADYRCRSRVVGVARRQGSASMMTFQEDELKVMIEAAHQLGVKVAAHATEPGTIKTLIKLGVDAIEHGYRMDDECVEMLSASETIWCPTLAAYYTLGGQPPGNSDAWESAKRVFSLALEKGVRIGCGGDTGVFAHGQNALELRLMVKLGADWRHVLRWATLGGWECVRSMAWEGAAGRLRLGNLGELKEGRDAVGDNDMPFGIIRKGFAADMIATSGDFQEDFEKALSTEAVKFVMKCGRLYKKDGIRVGGC